MQTKNLNIRQLCWSSSLPTIIWKEWILVSSTESRCIDLSDSTLADALRFCHPNLGFAALSHVINQIPGFEVEIASAYGLRWNERTAQVALLLARTPESF